MAPDGHSDPGPVTPLLPVQHRHQQSRLMARTLEKPRAALGSRTSTTEESPASPPQERGQAAAPGRSCADTTGPRPITEHSILDRTSSKVRAASPQEAMRQPAVFSSRIRPRRRRSRLAKADVARVPKHEPPCRDSRQDLIIASDLACPIADWLPVYVPRDVCHCWNAQRAFRSPTPAEYRQRACWSPRWTLPRPDEVSL